MKPPLSIRPLIEGERRQLEESLHAADAFGLRQAQYLLASARGLVPHQIATTYGGSQQNFRNVIRAFNSLGWECLTPKSRLPKTVRQLLEGAKLEQLQHLCSTFCTNRRAPSAKNKAPEARASWPKSPIRWTAPF